MTKSDERAIKARSLILQGDLRKPIRGGKTPINKRPGEVVCIYEKSGNVSLWDPGAWRRTMIIQYRKADKGDKENETDSD